MVRTGAETVKLQRTFRSPQSVCDISGRFVSKNPEQITKKVESYQDEYEPPLRAVAVESDEEYTSVVTTYLTSLDRTAPAAGERPLVVYILGRYNRGRDKVQPALDRPWRRLTVEYSTIHSAKGKEADYVIIVDVTNGGLPSTIEDDPLLALPMPVSEKFPHAEERRLFYVALTRTRRTVLLLTLTHRLSPFLLELIRDQDVTLESATGEPITVTPCPQCGEGRLVRRANRKTGNKFDGCSRFPKCRYIRTVSTPGGP